MAVGGLGLGAGMARLGHVVGDLYRNNPSFRTKVHNIGLRAEHMGPMEQALKQKGFDVGAKGVLGGGGAMYQGLVMGAERKAMDRLRMFRNRSAVGGGVLGVGGLGLSGYAIAKD